MTKLTTEITIEELQYRINAHENDLTQMWTADYLLNVQKELLALKQAAKNPVAWTDSDELEDANKGYSAYLFGLDGEANKFADPRRKIMLYAAPVLPKQPDVTLTNEGDITKIIKAAEKLVRCKGRYHSEQNYRALAALFGVTVPDLPPLPSDEAPAQPESEIPFGDVEPIEVTDDMVYAFHNRLSDGSLTSDEFTDIKQGLCAALMNIPRPAQPVIPERPELRYGDNVLWFLNELAAFDASDIDSDDFYVYGEGRNGMECCATISITELAADAAKLLSAQPVRLAYKLPNKVTAQDMRETFNYLMSEEEAQAAANGFNQCLLESNKLTNERGWIKGQFAYQDLFNAIGAAVVSKHPSIEISVKAFEDSMLAAAPAQESE